jgi:hypothetical protein
VLLLLLLLLGQLARRVQWALGSCSMRRSRLLLVVVWRHVLLLVAECHHRLLLGLLA